MLGDLPQLDLQQLTPTNPAAAEAWQQHLQAPVPPANSCYTSPHELHKQQHDHLLNQQPPSAHQHRAAVSPESLLLQQDAGLWRAYQVLSFLSHVRNTVLTLSHEPSDGTSNGIQTHIAHVCNPWELSCNAASGKEGARHVLAAHQP